MTNRLVGNVNDDGILRKVRKDYSDLKFYRIVIETFDDLYLREGLDYPGRRENDYFHLNLYDKFICLGDSKKKIGFYYKSF